MLEFEKVEQLTELYRKHISGELTETDKVLLDEMLVDLPHVKRMFDEASNEDVFLEKVFDYYNQAGEITDEVVQIQFQKSIGKPKVVPIKERKIFWLRYAAAASVIFLVAISVYFTFFERKLGDNQNASKRMAVQDVSPGSYKAKLTLADGSIIVLDSAALGELPKQGNVSVKNENGQLVYDEQEKNTEVLFNTLSTSIGESYSTLLADGSRILLNSGSSVKYPVVFTGHERVIEASGEIFLDVAKDAKRPFKVQVLQNAEKKCEVAVLGTSFNVMAYADEPQIQTTLLEGAIAITNAQDNTKKLLTPGQQAAIDADANMRVHDNVNTALVTAWKDQTFYFKNYDLKTIMRQLTRWYGVEVSYEDALPARTFTGMVAKNTNLSEVLKILEQTGIHFRIEGKKIIVLNP